MKNLRILSFALIATLLFASCSSDDDDGGNNDNEPITGNYFPSTVNDLWTFDVDNISSTHPELDFDESKTDFLKVATSTGNSFTVEVNNGLAYGTMNDILSVGTLTIGESTLSYSGELELPDEFSELSDESISLQNVLLYDLNASNNSVMTQVSNTIMEDIELNEDTVPLSIDYTLSTTKMSISNTMSVNGESYNNVIKTKLVLEVNIYATVPVFGNMTIIDNQEVLVIENYFAEDYGLIKSEAVQSYEMDSAFVALLNSTSTDLGVATSLHVVNTQELDDSLIQ